MRTPRRHFELPARWPSYAFAMGSALVLANGALAYVSEAPALMGLAAAFVWPFALVAAMNVERGSSHQVIGLGVALLMILGATQYDEDPSVIRVVVIAGATLLALFFATSARQADHGTG